MDASAQLPGAIVLAIGTLAIFLSYLVIIKYAVRDNFHRTRLTMTSFFFFIIITLTLSFWQYTLATLPYTAPAFAAGLVLGYLVGVRGAEERLKREGHEHYREHFAHIHVGGAGNIPWWSFINFYTIMGALVLINMVGFSTVLMPSETLAIGTSATGALLLGSIVPYLGHLWALGKHH